MQSFNKIDNTQLSRWLLRGSLALVFLYAAISSFVNPGDWVGYLPSFLRDSDSAELLLHGFSVAEVALAFWLVSGKYVQYAALAAAAMLGGIVLSNFSIFTITFRDMALMLAALALYCAEDS